MGSETSRLERSWPEAKVYRKLVTTKHKSKVVVICSLLPGMDETAMIDGLKKRSDLDTLFQLYCGSQALYVGDQTNLTIEIKAHELWRALQITLESGESPWDPNWQPPSKGNPSVIAAELHATVTHAVFRVPFLDFVKYALGYSKANFLENLLNAMCDVRDSLRTTLQDRPMTKELYIEVEKALTQQHHPLAHWMITSSLDRPKFTLHNALVSLLEPIQRIFTKRNFDLVLKQLAALDKRFSYVGQSYNWKEWSTDLIFWECVDQALRSEKGTTPFIPLCPSTLDLDEKLRFFEGFHALAETREHSTWSTAMFSLNKLKKTR